MHEAFEVYSLVKLTEQIETIAAYGNVLFYSANRTMRLRGSGSGFRWEVWDRNVHVSMSLYESDWEMYDFWDDADGLF